MSYSIPPGLPASTIPPVNPFAQSALAPASVWSGLPASGILPAIPFPQSSLAPASGLSGLPASALPFSQHQQGHAQSGMLPPTLPKPSARTHPPISDLGYKQAHSSGVHQNACENCFRDEIVCEKGHPGCVACRYSHRQCHYTSEWRKNRWGGTEKNYSFRPRRNNNKCFVCFILFEKCDGDRPSCRACRNRDTTRDDPTMRARYGCIYAYDQPFPNQSTGN
ncbi:uncharacterized protein BDZ99DRAFT_37572 [Mytilinidion resinicola]|uniref:Zn(2)-C6 fungal-type domain-containing protein n=1 Tax=Mytilinidion resinicola TaxID=574789 RepID=A0A6A6YLD9_9PEZI|nr:uncharacterized protein BDZ99DRAFT_37572 [Mytilinidion resinicola]KAF2808687.1 hypothetical protein BDZ99DRAFT_37572 [Mytilinidion resinicola]